MSVHPQVAALLERVARSPLPKYREYADMIHGFLFLGGVLGTANAAVAECCAALRRAFDEVAQ